MARRGSRTSRTTEVPVMRICGLRPTGDTASITVYRKGKSVRLSGPNGNHIVHPSNEKTSQGWIHEAILVWNLSNVYDEHPIHTDIEQSRQQFAALKAKGDELKRQLAEQAQKGS
jgi:hypothetical protein